jgi:hypothetical protein
MTTLTHRTLRDPQDGSRRRVDVLSACVSQRAFTPRPYGLSITSVSAFDTVCQAGFRIEVRTQ